jgi:ribosomal protein S18 acetylase RimI-like enzyme
MDRGEARASFVRLVTDDMLGRVWVLEFEGEPAGYVVLTLGYSMEYSGRDAFVDDLFIRERYRRRGLGRMAMDVVKSECRGRGVRALHLEVGRTNTAAKELYRRFGFVDHDRQLMTVALDDEGG